MAAFAYTAINAQGFLADGEIHAPTLDAAREQLRIRGLLAERLEELPSAGEDGVRTTFKKIKPKSLQVFSRQFATMIEAGLSVVTALVILEQQTEDNALAEVIDDVRDRVEGGALLSEAMAAHREVFSRLYIAMVEAGEAAGVLDVVLDRVALQIEKSEQIRRKVKSAMTYPIVVLVFATLVLIGMLLFLVPIFVKIFDQLHGQLPTLTQYVLMASNALRHYWFIIFPAVGGGIFGFFRWKKSSIGRPVWDRLRLRFPLKIGETILKITMARFSRTLSTLVAAG